jgi:transcriptional regulator with XRE-family HTH domain
MIKFLRSQKRISQEELAEMSGLSLRTIQRVEAGHRISYSSLRDLSSALNVDVYELEWELYAMNKTSDEYTESPLWVRVLLRKTWFSPVGGGHLSGRKAFSLFLQFAFPQRYCLCSTKLN